MPFAGLDEKTVRKTPLGHSFVFLLDTVACAEDCTFVSKKHARSTGTTSQITESTPCYPGGQTRSHRKYTKLMFPPDYAEPEAEDSSASSGGSAATKAVHAAEGAAVNAVDAAKGAAANAVDTAEGGVRRPWHRAPFQSGRCDSVLCKSWHPILRRLRLQAQEIHSYV